jgi:hypothetical protein
MTLVREHNIDVLLIVEYDCSAVSAAGTMIGHQNRRLPMIRR